MPYNPGLAPTDPDQVGRFLNTELQTLAQQLQASQPNAFLQTLNVAPKKPREGLIVKADGVNWNPGSGAGVYGYIGGAWVKFGGGSGFSWNSQSAAYTAVLTDGNNGIRHPAADTTARTWTLPANSSVAYAIGTTLTFDNEFGAGLLTISITTDTLSFVGIAGGTGSRTLASGGQATASKVTATTWRISGVGLS